MAGIRRPKWTQQLLFGVLQGNAASASEAFRTVSEGVFSEVRTWLRWVASCLRWKGMPRLRSGAGGRRRHVVPRVLDKKASADHVLHASLCARVVDLDPVCLWYHLPWAHLCLRTFPGGDHRDGPHQGHGGAESIVEPDGALAGRAGLVRCGAPGSRCGLSLCGVPQYPAWR